MKRLVKRWCWAVLVLGLFACGDEPAEPREPGDAGPEATVEPSPAPSSSEPSAADSRKTEPPRERDYLAEVKEALARHTQARPLSREEVQRIKDATVLIKTHWGAGSGFFFRLFPDDPAFVATNFHVVSQNDILPDTVDLLVKAGTPEQFTRKAKVVASTRADDLAVLSTGALPDGVAVLELAVSDTLFETQPVIVSGFPFGEQLGRGRTPSATIATGTVSGLRYDRYGQIERIQLDADLNPGNSGGPVLDYAGHVAGIAVETVEATNISFMLPASRLTGLLAGTVARIDPRIDRDERRLRVRFFLQDPMNRLHRVGVNRLPSTARPAATGPWRLAGAEVGSAVTLGDRRVEVVVPLEGSSRYESWFQPWYENHRGKVALKPFLLDEAREAGVAAQRFRKGTGGGWLGPTAPGAQPRAPNQRPVASFRNLLGEQKQTPDFRLHAINLPAEEIVDLVWSEGGEALFALDKRGVIYRLAVPSFDLEWQLATASPMTPPSEGGRAPTGGGLALSADGLVALLPAHQELWLLDPTTLEPEVAIGAPGMSFVATSPALSVAFTSADARSSAIRVYDLEEGRALRELKARDIPSSGVRVHPDGISLRDFGMLAATPNGRYLFTVYFETLHRLRIEGASLVYEEASARLGGGRRIEISRDSKYVALPTGGGNNQATGYPQIGSYATYVFPVENLSRPVVGIDSGAYPRTLGFDQVRNRIYAQNHDLSLITFDPKGIRSREYSFTPRGKGSRRLMPHPDGIGMIVLAQESLYWLRWN